MPCLVHANLLDNSALLRDLLEADEAEADGVALGGTTRKEF